MYNYRRAKTLRERSAKANYVPDDLEKINKIIDGTDPEYAKEEYEYNKTFGKQIAKVADYAVLIGEKRTKPIKEGLLDKGFDKDKIIVFNDVRDAYPFISTLVNKKDVYALFENDLPDTYNE